VGSNGCWGLLTTLGGWSLSKTRRQGLTWNVGAEDAGVSELAVGCGEGLTAVLGDQVGLVLGGEVATTLGDLCEFTLGGEGAGRWVGQRDRGASARHDSKISWREVIASSWETLVAGNAPQSTPSTTCKP
jgi:hypothetical protein